MLNIWRCRNYVVILRLQAVSGSLEPQAACRHSNKAFIRADSWPFGILAKFHTNVKGGATIDARRYVNICDWLFIRLSGEGWFVSSHIQRGSLALPSDVGGQCEKPRRVGLATDTDSCAFFVCNRLNSGVYKARQIHSLYERKRQEWRTAKPQTVLQESGKSCTPNPRCSPARINSNESPCFWRWG